MSKSTNTENKEKANDIIMNHMVWSMVTRGLEH